ncbi:hypothetical protein MKW98_026491 [Papaver atlanticum]|uniref:3-hydroxyisobutyryl-CoA hydrolase n=1 Tax=Papaver atlanticum TaxID=357466 RepID=A0AAD4SDL0_9MAGN|nr:hypothetical protein MKW98_026491 [Papaver atlanticum]
MAATQCLIVEHIEENLHARTVILNRAHNLNVLSSQMVSRLHEVFIACDKDPEVKLVILKGNGKAFCVGGDLTESFHDSTEGHWRLGARFLWSVYTLVYRIATLNKPRFQSLMECTFYLTRVIFLQVFAMPETGMGIVPDVGASFFLSKLPGFFGEYVGLTGARLDGTEMLACGLATHFVPSVKLSLLDEALNKLDTADPAIISTIIDKFSEQPPLKESSAYHRLDIIDRCFSQMTVEHVISALEIESVKCRDAWISEAVYLMKKASPIALKVFFQIVILVFIFTQIRGGRLLGLDQCLAREYKIVCHALPKEISHDMFEGYRAHFLRKDRTPKWEPSRLELVTDAMVDLYFSKVNADEWKDLVLPVRSNSSIFTIYGKALRISWIV